MKPKGGYHPHSRLATHLDELHIEAQLGLQSDSAAVKDRAFAEIARLARRCVELLDCFVSPGAASMATATA